MDQWVRDLILAAVKPLRGIIDAVVARFTALWSLLVGFFTHIRAGVTDLRNRVRGWIAAQVKAGLAALITLRWVITVYVPRRIAALTREVTVWATAQLARVAATARAALAAVEAWARQAVAAVRGAVADLTRWALAQVAQLTDWTRRLLAHVFGPLATADRVAAWILEPMVRALIRWALDNAARLGRVFWSARARLTLGALDLIEDLIARII